MRYRLAEFMRTTNQLPLLLSLLALISCTEQDARDGTFTFGSFDESSSSGSDAATGDGDGDPGDGDGDPGDGDGDLGDGDGDPGDGDGDPGDGDGDGDPGDGDGDPGECAPNLLLCDGLCIDPLSDLDYCGAVDDCLGANAGVICDPTPDSLCDGALGDSCQAGACAPACPGGMQDFSVTGEIEQFVLPECVVSIRMSVAGAQGGDSPAGGFGGMGARVEGELCIPPGTTLSVLVGAQGGPAQYPCGGGGGSFVVNDQTPLFVAGGGGGSYSGGNGGPANALSLGGPGVGGQLHNNGGGGGGFSTDGQGAAGSGGHSFLNGGAGGIEYPANNANTSAGGFGGGGGSSQFSTFNAGGGGGYDGGNAGNGSASTGGTSWIDPGATNTDFTPATQAGDGSVELSW